MEFKNIPTITLDDLTKQRAVDQSFFAREERKVQEFKEAVKQITKICSEMEENQLRLLIDVLKAMHDCQAASSPFEFTRKEPKHDPL